MIGLGLLQPDPVPLEHGHRVAVSHEPVVCCDRERKDRLADEPDGPPSRSFDTLIKTWKRTQKFKDARPRTQRGYEFYVAYIEDWSEATGHPDPTGLTKPDFEDFLSAFDERRTTKRLVKVVLKMVMDQAVDLGWRADNPVARIKMKQKRTKVAIWEAGDVDIYAWAALKAGQPDMAALILTMWEIGQRLTDVYLFQIGADFLPADGVFSFDQSKTDEPVAIPVSDRLRAVLTHISTPGKLYLFHDARTWRPWAKLIGNRLEADDNTASKVFAQVRAIAVAAGARPLLLKWLRHSCVVQLARSGVDIPGICSITGHTLKSAHSILQTYLPRDSTVARNAQMKRGLLKNAG